MGGVLTAGGGWVIANPPLVLAVLGGSLVGLGGFLLVNALMPVPPALGPALARLHPGAHPGEDRPLWNAVRGRFRPPHTDLAILGRSVDRYIVTLCLSALLALLMPAVLAIVVTVAHIPVSPFVPAGGSLLAAVGAAWLAHRETVDKAATARAEFTRAMCTYLDLAAHQVLGGHGPMESLERAASICHGWVFVQLREALLRAQLQLRPPWNELKELSTRVGVVELGDLADIMRTAGVEGAHVYQTLRARADSLRAQIRVHALEVAEVRTNKLDIPAAALILVLLVVIGYPFMVRLFTH